MSEPSPLRGLPPLLVGAGLELVALAWWAFEIVLVLPELLQGNPWDVLWTPQFELATDIDRWAAGPEGAWWVVLLFGVAIGPQVAAGVLAGVLGIVAAWRGRRPVQVGGCAVSALAIAMLLVATPAVLMSVFFTLYAAAGPKLW